MGLNSSKMISLPSDASAGRSKQTPPGTDGALLSQPMALHRCYVKLEAALLAGIGIP